MEALLLVELSEVAGYGYRSLTELTGVPGTGTYGRLTQKIRVL